jgi:uridine phosphorylase
MTENGKLLHINLAKGEVGKYVIVPGDPDRCEKIAAYLDRPRKVTQKREFTTWEGYIEGQLVTVTSTGIGGPSTAICIEELVKCGADTFIRVGTCASTSPLVGRGGVVVVNGTVRMEGTGAHYLPLEFPAVPNYEIMKLLEGTSRELGFPTTVGVTITKDSFYTQTEPETKPISGDLIKKWDAYIRGGAVATSMEEATLFLVAASLKVRSASVMVSATDYVNAVSKSNDASGYPTETIQRPIKVAVETIRKMILSPLQ